MINLLPYDIRKQLKAGRNNSALMKCLIILIAATIFLASACTFTAFSLNNSKEISDDLSKNTKLSQDTISVNEQAEEAKTNIATAKKILDNQILYSKVLDSLSNAIGDNGSLDSLNIDNVSIDRPVTIKLHTASTAAISSIASSIQASPVFSSYNLVSAEQDNSNKTYPTAVTIKVTINKEKLHEK